MAAGPQSIPARLTELGGLPIRRALPRIRSRSVGPFVFLDEMGPAELGAGRGLDVPPHPHIGLATLTWLLEGALLHRDSLGVVQRIAPGEVNWMTAGRGVTHSERSPEDERRAGARLHGLQFWVALPAEAEARDPAFEHRCAAELPVIEDEGRRIILVAGAWGGARSPVRLDSELALLDLHLAPGATWEAPEGGWETAVYLSSGRALCEDLNFGRGELVRLPEGARIRALEACRGVAFGGPPLAEPREMFWNFVSVDPARIEAAKADWRAGRFPEVPGEGAPAPMPER